MELKKYQEDVLKDLDNYIENVKFTRSAAKAYDKLWHDKGVRVGGLNGLQLYNNLFEGVPSVCFKVPTGGGKTILGCAALKHIFDAMSSEKKKVVVWLVPWETILTQTYNNLKNPSHFYRERLNRDFASRVEIYNKQQVLNGTNFNPSAVNDQLSVIVMSFDSLRAKNKDERKVYEENSNLMPFVETYQNRDELIKNVDDSALMQVLNQLRPVVVIDESHNAQTNLSKEMVKNLNPSFVVELTATPKKDSNIISIVTANQLKEANMVKLPVIAYNRPSVERVMSEALDLRNSLERAAKYEKEHNGSPYIRPIILFQAQPRSDEDSITFDKVKQQLIELGIPEEEIAIKTANKNELAGVDLMSEDCKIRFIITINALKEGWDCPFAYILASLANRTSRIDVEQILGRILRQPHQRRYESKILNMSYVLTSSNDFATTLDDILAGLNSAGFSNNDCRYVTTATLDNLTEDIPTEQTSGGQTTIFDNVSSESEDVDSGIFNVEEVRNIIESHNITQEVTIENEETYTPNEPESPNDDVNKMLNQALEESEKYDEQVEEAQREGTANIPEEYHNYTNVFAVKDEFKDEIRDLKLPRFAFRKEGTLFSGDEAVYPVSVEYLNDGFNLNTARIPDGLISATEGVYKVDVETTSEGSVVKKSMLIREESDEFKRMLQMIPEKSRVNVCKSKLVGDLNNKFNNISHAAIVNYIDRIVASFKTEDEVVALQSNINAISIRIKNFINELLEEYRYKNFKDKLVSNDIFIDQEILGYQMKMSITLPEHTSEYFRTLYKEEDNNVNSLEEKFMLKVASLPNVKWWHRNIDRNEYALNGYLNHYADFIVETNNGTIILVETKGEHLDGDDSKKKLELGKLWSTYSGPTKYKYFMAFEKSPLAEDGADLLDNIIQKISRL